MHELLGERLENLGLSNAKMLFWAFNIMAKNLEKLFQMVKKYED
jgi:preprotein translocase subunit SecY